MAAFCSASFLLRPQAAAYGRLPDHSGHLEALVVIGALFVEQIVARRGAELALGCLLQQGLEITPLSSCCFAFDFGQQVAENEFPTRLQSAVQIDGCHQRFENISEQIGGDGRMRIHALAKEEEITEIELTADARQARRLTTADLIFVRSPSW